MPSRPRVALYSHDAMGLGHVRRNSLIASTLASSHLRANVLLISGAVELRAFSLPPRVDALTLPALQKKANGCYSSRRLSIPLSELISLRAQVIRTAIERFQPDAFIVDKLPVGLHGELLPTLRELREQQRTCCILGLRDILDEPAAVRRQWSLENTQSNIREYYNAVWVYGDPGVYNPLEEYDIDSDIASRVHFTGYLKPASAGDARKRIGLRSGQGMPRGRFVLCQVGGGQDGSRLARAFARADLPPDMKGLILTGPFMSASDRQDLYEVRGQNPKLSIRDFVPQPETLLLRSERVVSMGGYNSLCETLTHRKPLLVVPRVEPRREQFIRATRFHRLGLLDVLHPHEATPRAISQWLAGNSGIPPDPTECIDFGGCSRIPVLLEELFRVGGSDSTCGQDARVRRHRLVGTK